MQYTVVIPSKDAKNLEFCLEYLIARSTRIGQVIVMWNGKESFSYDDPLVAIVEERGKGVYYYFNRGVELSSDTYVLLMNDDMVPSIGWDENLDDIFEETNKIPFITFQVVEPGYVSVNDKNIKMNFGDTPETFDVLGFDKFARDNNSGQIIDFEKLGWFQPCIINKHVFLSLGGFNTEPEFPYPQDIFFTDKLLAKENIIASWINSYFYHFQRLSQRGTLLENVPSIDKLNLCCGNDPREGYLNCDIDKGDIHIDITNPLPFANESFSEILFFHALEHFRPEIAERILIEIHRVLKVGGVLKVFVPDFTLACEDFLAGFNSYPDCAPAVHRIFGLADSEFQVHKWGYTKESLAVILEQIGFKNLNFQKRYADEIGYFASK